METTVAKNATVQIEGNHEAAGWMSVICSLIGTCREHNVNPRLYLNGVIAKMLYNVRAVTTIGYSPNSM